LKKITKYRILKKQQAATGARLDNIMSEKYSCRPALKIVGKNNYKL